MIGAIIYLKRKFLIKYTALLNAGKQQQKEKIAKRYQEKRRHNPNRKLRTCKKCDKKLSIYNDDPLCQECLVNPKEVLDALKNIKGLADGKTNINNE